MKRGAVGAIGSSSQAATAHWLEADGGRSPSAAKGLVMAVTTRSGISDNAASAIAYFTFIPAFLFLLLPPYKQSNYVRFHAWQSVLLDVTAFMVEIVVGAIALLTLFLGAIALADSVARVLHPGHAREAVQATAIGKYC
jgi:uncharacterized membrane protein